MTRWVLVVSFPADATDEVIDAWVHEANQLGGGGHPTISRSVAGRHLPGSRGAGDATWDLTISPARPEEAPLVARMIGRDEVMVTEQVALDVIASRTVSIDGPRIKRTLLVALAPSTAVTTAASFERSLTAMPDHIDTIRSWALSRVDRPRSSGPWTHVWEQEYADVDGLRGPYMQNQYHWTGVEQWFDPEIPGSIVDDIAHLFHHAPSAVL